MNKREHEMENADMAGVVELTAKAICETLFGIYDPKEADGSIHSPSGQAREAAKAAIEQIPINPVEFRELASWARAVPCSLLADNSPNAKHYERIAQVLEDLATIDGSKPDNANSVAEL
jgi:hypothetical protein